MSSPDSLPAPGPRPDPTILIAGAGITTADEHIRIGAVTTGEFMSVMITNALSPMRVIESLQDLVHQSRASRSRA